MYFGYELFAALYCLVEAVLFWQLGLLARAHGPVTRPIAMLFIFANAMHVALCLRYFFLTPVFPDLAIMDSLSLAWVAARRPDGM